MYRVHSGITRYEKNDYYSVAQIVTVRPTVRLLRRIFFLRRHYPDQVQGTGSDITPLHLSRTCVQRPCYSVALRSIYIYYILWKYASRLLWLCKIHRALPTLLPRYRKRSEIILGNRVPVGRERYGKLSHTALHTGLLRLGADIVTDGIID